MAATKVSLDAWDAFLQDVKERGLYEEFTRICRERSVTLQAAFGQRRSTAVAHARFHLWLFLSESRKYSCSEIGRLFGRNHTTVIQGLHRAKGLPPKGRRSSLVKKDEEP